LVPKICGFGDKIPGIVEIFIPNCVDISDDKIELAANFAVFISSI